VEKQLFKADFIYFYCDLPFNKNFMKTSTTFHLQLLRSAAFLAVIFMVFPVFGQLEKTSPVNKKFIQQGEFPTGNYVPSPRESHAKSPAYRFDGTGFSVVQVNVDDNGFNILDDAANEPSIAFDPNDPNRIAIGWRQFDNINNSFRQAGFGFTYDAGETWIFPGVIDQGIFRSDPVLRSDREGNFYYNSLTNNGGDYSCNVYKSEDGGEIWEMGTYAQGGDKQWMSVDMTQGIGSGNIYAFWNPSYSACPPYGFTRSTDGNNSYPECSSVPNDPVWGTTMVDPEGNLYMCGAVWSGFMVTRSPDAKDPGLEVSWDITSDVFLDGEIIGFGGYQCPNPEGLLGQTIIAMDSSGGPGDGNIYLLCSVERNSNSDPCDVMFARSTDGGETWDWPVRVNDDPGNNAWQWFGTMSVAPDGRIDVIWLDTRDNPGDVNSALYYSYSLDEGTTWSQNEKLSESFDPHVGWPQQNKMGDYLDMYSDEDGAHLAWAATFNGEQDVYYSVIKPDYTGLEDGNQELARLSINYPNPFNDQTTIRYQVTSKEQVSLKVYTAAGKEVTVLADGMHNAGLYRKVFDGTGLESGVYYYRLQTGDRMETGRMILVR
jgi:hypothetical protein